MIRGQRVNDALPSAIEEAGGEVLFAHPLKYRIECRALRRNQLQRATRHRRDVGPVDASARWRGAHWFYLRTAEVTGILKDVFMS